MGLSPDVLHCPLIAPHTVNTTDEIIAQAQLINGLSPEQFAASLRKLQFIIPPLQDRSLFWRQSAKICRPEALAQLTKDPALIARRVTTLSFYFREDLGEVFAADPEILLSKFDETERFLRLVSAHFPINPEVGGVESFFHPRRQIMTEDARILIAAANESRLKHEEFVQRLAALLAAYPRLLERMPLHSPNLIGPLLAADLDLIKQRAATLIPSRPDLTETDFIANFPLVVAVERLFFVAVEYLKEESAANGGNATSASGSATDQQQQGRGALSPGPGSDSDRGESPAGRSDRDPDRDPEPDFGAREQPQRSRRT